MLSPAVNSHVRFPGCCWLCSPHPSQVSRLPPQAGTRVGGNRGHNRPSALPTFRGENTLKGGEKDQRPVRESPELLVQRSRGNGGAGGG